MPFDESRGMMFAVPDEQGKTSQGSGARISVKIFSKLEQKRGGTILRSTGQLDKQKGYVIFNGGIPKIILIKDFLQEYIYQIINLGGVALENSDT